VNAKTTIRKFLFVSLWLIIGAGMLTLLIAAIGKQHREQCRDYLINIRGAEKNFFMDTKDIRQLLMSATGGPIKGQPISAFKLHQLEQLLEDNIWIKDAELYFTNRDVLHVNITEQEPIARIFTTGGNSFYIDSLGRRMPLSDKLSARVPVFTGFPEKKTLTKKDSLLLQDVKTTASFIINDSFWMAQVAQIDITPERNFEMIPVVGDHIVRLGNAEDMDQKFHRLFVFYLQVLSKTGFNKYKVLDVQYAGQVVASKQTGNTKVDSVQLKKNVDKLLKQAQESEEDAMVIAQPLPEKPGVKADSAIALRTDLKEGAGKTKTVSKPVKMIGHKVPVINPNAKTDKKREEEKKKPKAVMPTKAVN
jgi:cell division protein FtsQ